MTRKRPAPLPTPIARGRCGYADLLRAYAVGGEDELAVAAELAGYRRSGQRRKDPPLKAGAKTKPTGDVPPEPPIADLAPLADVPFWRPTVYKRHGGDSEAPSGTEPSAPALELADVLPPPSASADLAPWNAVVSAMRQSAVEWTRGRAPDIPAVLRHVEKGRLLDRLPRRRHRRWGSAIQFIIDRSERLVPFYGDQERVAGNLSRLFPAHAVERATMEDGLEEPVLSDRHGYPKRYRPPPVGTLVVVLGDLGCLAAGGSRLIHQWHAFGERLALEGCCPVALTPCPRARWQPEMARAWRMVEWDRRADAPTDPDGLALRVERLLALASPAVRLEPALLRDLRLLLGGQADAGTESDLWQHRALVGRSCVAGTLDPAAGIAGRAALHRTESALIPEVAALLRRHHAARPDIWMEELLRLDPASLPSDLRDGDMAWARERLTAFARSLTDNPVDLPYARRFYRRGVEDIQGQTDDAVTTSLSRLYAAAFVASKDAPPPPPGFDPAFVGGRGPERTVALRQIGCQLMVASDSGETGSPLLSLRTANGLIAIEGEDRDAFWKSGIPPAWAENWGWDSFGAWVTFRVATVVQKMRWIAPGRFRMGSPEDEAKRDADEGPQHEVTLTYGFWLFDTACSQALWRAVMDKNPSSFQDDKRRPVEQVSWTDVRGFLKRINRRLPGLSLGLPTEAQWEYACRAGTTTPFSFGGTITPDQVNYDGNHPYRDGPKGLYRNQTVPVGSLPPNPWGLYEMHGNVWEWCADGRRDYTGEAVTDPRGPETADAERVLRGGSWFGGAWYVRAAFRNRYAPDARFARFGFRCASGQASRDGGAEPAAPASPRLAVRRGVPGMTGATVLRMESGGRCPLPNTPAVRIVTDREEVRLERLTRPAWADALGRDRFGLWADLAVPPLRGGDPVVQRLRWIAPGRFRMGSPEDEAERYADEGPQHAVTLTRGFWLFDTACSQALWRAVMDENPSRFQNDERCPVERVSWTDIQGFLERINQHLPGLSLGLPTEAQWEYACRAGTTTPFSFGGTVTPDQVNYDGNSPYRDGPSRSLIVDLF
ncbi:SUMF1/EgtB/PvdO family nonheme iron enzyme [Azospirillum sp. YIM DDC1]|uniref:SUMF1/EgtB/PvdO family nonheme iron enzyme n=1 Tax=Azospirillum aestuarii TaxID=2802052 RepID=A0ABS1I6T9_9PROT|nr:formylglycine-generating enzyme family protein [Azospirillum aestuarii]MBK4722417.1 SUMF1/EgtB/PvdO family nonheme iron enzyme [Azospirillum aestuarii]